MPASTHWERGPIVTIIFTFPVRGPLEEEMVDALVHGVHHLTGPSMAVVCVLLQEGLHPTAGVVGWWRWVGMALSE